MTDRRGVSPDRPARPGAPALVRVSAMAALVVLTASCGLFRGKLPPHEMYGLALPDTSTLALPLASSRDGAPVAPAPLAGPLAIAPYRTPGIYAGQGIVYRIGELQYGSYPSREWAMPLAMMLGAITERVLHANPLSTEPAIHEPPARVAHPFTWQGTVREFEEVNRERDVFVSVMLEVRIIRSADQAIVWQGSEKIERPVPEPTMLAIVEALSDAAAETVTRLAVTARADLLRSPPTASR